MEEPKKDEIKKEETKKENTKKESKENKKNKPLHKQAVHHVKRFLGWTIGVPVFLILILAALALVKVPYNAKESYIDIVSEQVTINESHDDLTKPIYERICEDIPSVETVKSQFVYGKPYGLNGFKCYAEFKVTNENKTEGEWTYRFIFNMGGKLNYSKTITENIPGGATMKFEFETEECKSEDTISGEYELISRPITNTCYYLTKYAQIVVPKTEIVKREVKKERLVTKQEPLWQKILGYNNFEKA
jgi:hypothetical protein